MRLIIAYKIVKAVAVLALACVLTFASGTAYGEARHLVHELAEHGGLLHRLSAWLDLHVTLGAVKTLRLIAWADGLLTALEAALLLSGKVWGEWLVVGGLAVLLPFEAHAVIVHHRVAHVIVLVVNTVIVVYLFRDQLARHRAHAAATRSR
jgi:uncharacterized membrane protein (DUF2068 family)